MRAVLIDDEKLIVEEMQHTLEETCAFSDIAAFTSTKDFLHWLEKNTADIAFLDIEMEGQDGVSLARQVKMLYPKMYIIFVTAYSEYALQAIQLHANGYLLKPVSASDVINELQEINILAKPENKLLRVQTFGNFEVFADGSQVNFISQKAKEMLAYLVDRRGAGVTVSELSAILYENVSNEKTAKSNVRHALSDLQHTLSSVGALPVLKKTRNNYSVNTALLDCDYYRVLSGDAAAVSTFMGEYMSRYEWAEVTLAFLFRNYKTNG